MKYQGTIRKFAEEAKRKSSRFDEERYHIIANSAIAHLCPDGPGEDEYVTSMVARSYLRLLAEAVSMGCFVTEASGDHRELLAELLLELIPTHLRKVPAERRVECLAMLWNLGEGLLQEPAWMNRYAIARCRDVTDLLGMPEHLVSILEPVLVSRPPSQWKGPCEVRVLDPRSLDETFLPGAMHLAAPSVVCVHGRRERHPVHVGVLLEHGGRSRFLGRTPCLGASIHDGALPAVTFTPGKVAIGERTAAMPHLRAPLDKLVIASGFVLATAIDSQRIWVVDTP